MDAEKTQNDNRNAVLAVALAGAVQVAVTDGPFDGWDLIVGIIMAAILKTYEISTEAKGKELRVLAGAWGLTLIIILASVGSLVLYNAETPFKSLPKTSNPNLSFAAAAAWFFVSWVCYCVLKPHEPS